MGRWAPVPRNRRRGWEDRSRETEERWTAVLRVRGFLLRAVRIEEDKALWGFASESCFRKTCVAVACSISCLNGRNTYLCLWLDALPPGTPQPRIPTPLRHAPLENVHCDLGVVLRDFHQVVL